MKNKFRIMSARHGVDKNGKAYSSLSLLGTTEVFGAHVDFFADRYIAGDSKPGEMLKAGLDAAKANGTGLFVEVTDIKMETRPGQKYVPKGETEAVWGNPQHAIIGGVFGDVTEEARNAGNVDMTAMFASLGAIKVAPKAESDLPPKTEIANKPGLTIVAKEPVA